MAAQESGIEITPSELRFSFFPNKQLLTTLSIANGTDARIAFKVKTTAAKRYVVRPSTGVVELKSHGAIQVIMVAQDHYDEELSDCKDKFMVQTVVLTDGEEVNEQTFNKEVRKSAIREARLRVVVDPPPAVLDTPTIEEEALDEAELRALELRNLKAAEQLEKLSQLSKDLAAAQKDKKHLQEAVAKLEAERDELRKTLDMVELQQDGKPSASTPMQFRVSLIHIVLAAILAYLIGHYV